MVSARPASAPSRTAFATTAQRRKTIAILGGLGILAVVVAFGLLAYANPMPVGSEPFWRIANLRVNAVIVIAVVAVAQAMATVSFQTVTNNRILTPSIMGFEALYVAVQTSGIYFLGLAGLLALQGPGQFAMQVVLMVAFAVALYSWLLSGRFGNIQIMLLVGIVIGGGLGAIATFMQRMLTPSEFDILAARLFGNISNADASYFPLAIPLVVIASALIWSRARRLNVLALGRETSISLGVDHRREQLIMLTLISVLMAVSTALIGPLTFFGFLVATLTYQMVGTYDHRYMFPVAALLAFCVLGGAYFIMRHVFAAQGVVGIIIEIVGGTVFLIVLLRKGRL